MAILLVSVLFVGPVALAVSGPASGAPILTPPDLQILVPANDISIGTNPDTGDRQLQFTHVTWDAGTGPFLITPTYTKATGMAKFSQTIYNSPSHGVWRPAFKVPLAPIGVFDAPSDYRFPLTRFTLNEINGDGTLGPVVATSPKTDYCITADTYVGGVPNTPNRTTPPQVDCVNPRRPLGFSVGWGDEYDQTDRGQPIDLTGIPDGTYVLHALVDPLHAFTESDNTNDVVDTTVAISGMNVTVLSQASPLTVPPTVALTSPANGSTVSGSVDLQVAATANAPATLDSVQYLLDGEPLGLPATVAPFDFEWNTVSTFLGSHTLSAEATDSSGTVATAPVETVTVVPSGGSGLALDASITKNAKTTATATGLTTSSAGDTVLAFVGADGPAGTGMQSATVSGAGLSWTLVERSTGQFGDAEVWRATAPGTLSAARVTSKLAKPGYDEQLTVLAFQGSAGVGASSVASAPSGAPSVSLTTTAAGSVSFAVGMDWDNAEGRTADGGQLLVTQWIDSTSGDTFWAQGTSTVSSAAGEPVTLDDTTPTSDQWNFAAVEVVPSSDPPTAAPLVSFDNPIGGQPVSGTVTLAASVTDNVALRSVQFLVDGHPVGRPVTAAPYSLRWNTVGVASGVHTLAATATNGAGMTDTSMPVTATVQNPAPAMTCFVLQARTGASGLGTVTTRPLHTASTDETLVAFVSADGPGGVRGLRGAGLKWRLVQRAASSAGDTEIWTATTSTVLPSATVTSVLDNPKHHQHVALIAMEGVDGVGASAAATGRTGMPALALRTSRGVSLVFTLGEVTGSAAPASRVGWVKMEQWTDRSTDSTFWSAYTNQPTGPNKTVVTVDASTSSQGSWDLVAAELTNDEA